MRITFLLPFVGLAGGVKSTFELAGRLQERGHDIRIYYPKYKNLFLRRTNLMTTLRSVVRPLIGRGKPFIFRKDVRFEQVPFFFDRYVDDGDAVIGTWWEDIYPMMSLSGSKGRKFHFIRHHEIWGGSEKKVDRAYNFRNEKIVVSSWLGKIMKERYGMESRLCPNGVDRKRFYCEGGRSSPGSVGIGLLYNPSWEWKGMGDAVRVLGKVWRRFGGRVRFVLFGARVKEELPFPFEHVHRPFGDAIRRVYSDLDIFLFTSRAEGFGNPPLEAMACRTAVVSTRVGGVPDYSEDGGDILLAEPGDVPAMVEKVSLLVEDAGLRERLAAGAEEATVAFSWERSTDTLEKILQRK